MPIVEWPAGTHICTSENLRYPHACLPALLEIEQKHAKTVDVSQKTTETVSAKKPYAYLADRSAPLTRLASRY
jgi:hypothetical protein